MPAASAPVATSAPATARATPEATVEAECPTPAERRCFLEVSEKTGPISESLGELGDLFILAGNDATIIFSEDWRSAFVVLNAEELLALDVPSSVPHNQGSYRPDGQKEHSAS